jgi:tetratricopeptide (TPR) repeat protein
MLAQILVAEKNFDEAIDVVEGLLEKDSKNMELLMLKAEICFLSERLFECEEVFLYLLKLKPSSAYSYSVYLRLGLTYLNRKSWEDAKTTFNKAVELKPNSAAGWLGLGIANLRLSLPKESEEALNLSRIYNPLSSEAGEYLR